MSPLRNTVNRTLLALTGGLLLAGGAWSAATHPSVTGRLPPWWPTAEPNSALLDRSQLDALRDHGWWTPLVVTTVVCAQLLLVGWFLAQLRSGGRRRLPLTSPALTLRCRALADVVARRIETAPGVQRAHVRLLAGTKRSRARVRLVLEPGATPGPVLERLTRGALDEAHRSLAPHLLETQVRIGVRSHRERRVR